MGLDAGCDVEVGICHYSGAGAGADQVARTTEPLDEVLSQARAAAASADPILSPVHQSHKVGIADRLRHAAQRT
jgi:hypothetical protein